MLYVIRRLTIEIIRLPHVCWTRYRDAAALWRSRQALLHLDPYQLDDIGITRAEAEREARKGFWQNTAPWAEDAPFLHGDPYLAGRPVTAMRSFYRTRGRGELPDHI